MYILAIETTGPKGSVALMKLAAGHKPGAVPSGADADVDVTCAGYGPSGADAPIAMKTTTEPMGHLRNLMVMAEDLLAEAGAVPADIGLVACSVGPGSYTGIRIGVSSARAIAQALGVPCVSVGALDQFRLVALSTGRPVAVIFNARRGQVYGAVFDVVPCQAAGGAGTGASADDETGRCAKASVRDVLSPGPYMLTDVLEKTADVPGVVFYGDGVDAYLDQLEGYELAPEAERYPAAEMTLRAALEQLAKEGGAGAEPGEPSAAQAPGNVAGAEPVGYGDLLPRYMRETEADQKLKDGTLARLREAKMAKFRSR